MATPARGSPDHTGPVTDFALFESQKENIRPLATGRSAATLGVLFDKAADEAEKVVQEGIERLQKDIDEAERRDREGEDMVDGVLDVLDVYNRYVTFLIQHYPSSPARVLPHLESTTRRFVDDARFAQDARYLKLWTMYARQVERREEVWSFLESRSIGTMHAGFYEEWASALEGLGRKKKADDVYRLGIARRAAPLERLKNRHQSFLTRIMAPPSGVVPDDPPEVMAPRQRSVLGQVGSGLPSSVSGATQQAGSSRISSGRNGSKMAIFSDTSAAGEQPESTPWDDFGSRDGRRKENTVDATPWKGETLKQGRALAPRTPKLEVFKDANEAAGSGGVHSAEGVLGGLRPKAPVSEAELLRADPLKNFDTSGVQTTVPQIPSLPAPPSARKPPAKKQRRERDQAVSGHKWECPTEGAETMVGGKMQRRMFDWDATFRNGEEYSFQEVRARKMGLLGKDWKELKDWEKAWHKPGSTTPQPKKPPPRAPSPTLNTKLANEEVMSLFNQTIHGGKVRDPDFFSSDEDEDEDDDVEVVEAAPLPTPLPPPRHAVAMMTPGGMIPPTPTPAPGRGVPQQMNIFSQPPAVLDDENAPTPAPKKLSIFADENGGDENAAPAPSRKMNVFQETPARAPLSSRAPLGGKRTFGVFEEDAENRTPAPARNAFAAQPQARGVPSPVAEEEEQQPYPDENANAENAHPAENEVYHEYYDDNYADENDGRAHNLRRFDKFRTMTPIAERTIEYTMNTTRSRASAILDENDSESVLPLSSSVRQELAAVVEEDERSARSNRSSPQVLQDRRVSDSRRDSESRRVSEPRRVSASRPESPPSHAEASRRESAASYRTEASRRESGASYRTEDSRRDSSALYRTEASRRESGGSRRDSGLRHDSDSSRFDPPSAGLDMPDEFTYHSGSVDATAFGVPDGYTIHRSIEGASAMMDRLEVVDHGDVSMAAPQEDEPAATVEISNPCNLGAEDVINALLQRVQPPVSSLPLFVDRRDIASSRRALLERAAKARSRRSSAASLRSSTAPSDDAYILDLGTQYEICSKLGEGGFGAVFLAVDIAARAAAEADSDDDSESDSDDEGDKNEGLVAIKVEKPCALWEAVMLDSVHRRVSPELATSIIRPRGLHAFADESFLLLDYVSQGTLLNVVNKSVVWGVAQGTPSPPAPDELVAIFFTIELLKLVEGLHAADIIHGDLKIDNCLVRLEVGTRAWASQYDRTGKGGWNLCGIRLIDFGRAADLRLFPAGCKQRFVADWKTDARDCIEMRDGRDWSFETDYFGLASIAYCLLFGKYIGTERTSDGRYKIDTALKRYWQTDLWNKLFDVLLNPTTYGELPITNHLADVRGQFETFLEDNCLKNGKSLKQLLKRLELCALEGR